MQYWYAGQPVLGVQNVNDSGTMRYWTAGQPDGWLPGTGLTNYTLAVDAGTFTFTGQNAGLIVNRATGFGAGVFTFTGQDAGLRVDYRTAPAAGVFTFTGQSASSLRGYAIAPAAGVFTFTGQNSVLLAARTILPAAGAFTFTGKSTRSSTTRGFSAAAGSWTFTGQFAKLYKPIVKLNFAEFNNGSFLDWTDQACTSFFEVQQQLQDPSLKTQAPYIYTFLKETAASTLTSDSATLQVGWDWVDLTNVRSTPPEEMYNYRNGYLTSVKKTRIRGKGRGIKSRYESSAGKDFNILGWVIFYDSNQGQ